MLMSGSSNKIGIGKAFLWGGLTIAGCLIAILLTVWLSLVDPGPFRLATMVVGGAIGGAMSGLVVGFSQRSLLPAWLSGTPIWIWVTPVGWAVGVGVYWLFEAMIYETFYDYPKPGLDPTTTVLISVGQISLSGLCLVTIEGAFLLSRAMHVGRWFVLSGIGWIIGDAICFLVIGLLVGLGVQSLAAVALLLIPGIGGLSMALATNSLVPRRNSKEV